MRRITLALAFAVVALGGSALADEKDNKKALEQLQGDYVVIGLEQGDMKLTAADLQKVPDPKVLQVTIKGEEILSSFTKSEDKAKIKIDASKSPAHFDIITVSGGKSLTDYGIYQFKDNVLTICAAINSEAKDRPTEFKSGKNVIVLKLEKKPAK